MSTFEFVTLEAGTCETGTSNSCLGENQLPIKPYPTYRTILDLNDRLEDGGPCTFALSLAVLFESLFVPGRRCLNVSISLIIWVYWPWTFLLAATSS